MITNEIILLILTCVITRLFIYILYDYEVDVDIQIVNERFVQVFKELPEYKELKLLLEYAAERDLLGCYQTDKNFVIDNFLFINYQKDSYFKVYYEDVLVYEIKQYTRIDDRIKEKLYAYVDYIRRIHGYGY